MDTYAAVIPSMGRGAADIAEQLFTEGGFTDFKVKVLKPLAQRVYCVQYRESTLAFVSRPSCAFGRARYRLPLRAFRCDAWIVKGPWFYAG